MSQEANAAANPRLGRYEILGEIGKGGMGIVYRAMDPAIGRTVAIKTVRFLDQGSQEEVERLRARLLRECQASGQLSHPNIVPIFDYGEQDDVAYIVMEYISGRTLEQAMSDDPEIRSANVALGILSDCARALDYAHGKGIVHRDVKPQNIMLQTDGALKIADFGIAKVLQGATLTMASMMVGSPHYMAPEQMKSDAVTGRADQYALATLAYALLTGRRPFEGDSMVTLITKTLYEEPPPATDLNPALNADVDTVLRKGLAKDPAARYGSCSEFVQALRTACGLSTGPAPIVETITPVRPATPVARPVEQPMPRRPAKPRWVAFTVGVIALIAAGSGGFYLYQANEASRVELAYWDSVKESKNADLYASYIQRYPNGQFVSLARAEIAALKAASPAATPPSPAAAPAIPTRLPPAPPPQPAAATHPAATIPAAAKTPESPAVKPPAPLAAETCRSGLGEFKPDQFQKCAEIMSKRGLTASVATAFRNGGDAFVLVAFQPVANRRATLLTPPAEREELLTKMMKEGLRPMTVSIIGSTSGPLFTQVWTPREAPFEIRPALLKEGLDKVQQRHKRDGYMITDLVPFGGRKQIHYSVIWVAAPGLDTVALSELTPSDLEARDRTLNQQGYRMSHITGYEGDSGKLYAAVWQKSQFNSTWRIGLARDGLFKLHEEMTGKHFHINHLGWAGGAFSAVWWSDPR